MCAETSAAVPFKVAQVEVEQQSGRAERGKEEADDHLRHDDRHDQAALGVVPVGILGEKVEGLALIQRRQEQEWFRDSITNRRINCYKPRT